MKISLNILLTGVVLTLGTTPAFSQTPVQVGRGSYASTTPLSKSRSADHAGDQSRYMQYRQLNIREQAGRPIPTNDWWTNLINADDKHVGQELTGHLWAYPQMVQGMKSGLDIHYPTTWISNGTEMQALSKLTLRADDFTPTSPLAEAWSDFAMTFSESDGNRRLITTLAHGIPFTWIETNELSPIISAEATSLGSSTLAVGAKPAFLAADGSELKQGQAHSLTQFIVSYGDGVSTDLYGIYLPEGATIYINERAQGHVTFASERQFVVVALLPSVADLAVYADYAYSRPTNTTVAWTYDEAAGRLTTRWQVAATDLRTGQPTDAVLQGFLPHHYRGGATPAFPFSSQNYPTPHGRLCIAAGNDLAVDYRFYGILPWWPSPDAAFSDDEAQANNTSSALSSQANAFRSDRMLQLISEYATAGTFGTDTYWGGKGLTQMALYMSFAREMGNLELFRQCRDRLKAVLIDWLTYTPGESNRFFARDTRYGGLIGYDTSYDSETYNDHHFHYGYYTLAGAMLALVDDDFREGYGQMLRLVAKDYANWQRDSWACFFRTFDPWGGHSFAGGMGDGNGNGQESSSEAMQAWGGIYLLGVALGDKEMRDAGIFGWVSEARGTAEYWFDRHGETITPDFHTGYNTDYNIDYSKLQHVTNGVVDYTVPYNSNYTCHGVGWWTYFSGDPVWMAGIQWMPISPALDYLSEDTAFAAWDYQRMWDIKEIGGWFDYNNPAGCLGRESGIGNVVLAYLQRSDPEQAAAIFDRLYDEGQPLARNADTGGITYYATHSHLAYGEPDWTINGSTPTSRAYNNRGVITYVGYNPTDAPIDITFRRDGQTLYTLTDVPPRQMLVSGRKSSAVTEVVAPQAEAVCMLDSMVMRNLALGKTCYESSHENVGTVRSHATDGDPTTRWGSEHRDGEWLTVDLGEAADIYRVSILWEAAYASEYEILVSTDNATFTHVATEHCSAAGWVSTDLADGLLHTEAHGRYVRIVGTHRGTAYGTSLFEIEVYGRTASMTDTDILGLKIEAAEPMLHQGQPTQLQAAAYTCGGQWVSTKVDWSSQDGTVTTDGVFTPQTYGVVSVTAATDGFTATKQLPCEEAIVAKSLTIEPKEVTVAQGEVVLYDVALTDQFGVVMQRYTSVYYANSVGTHHVIVTEGGLTDTLTVHVVRFDEVNLAPLGRTSASSINGDADASRATDGDTSTRWESQWQSNDEWLCVDLRGPYRVSSVVLRWEAAYATAYSIAVSTDGDEWTEVYSTTSSAGGTETIDFDPVAARYVRLNLHRRALSAYGYSLFEMEVYAVESLTPTVVAPMPASTQPEGSSRSAIVCDLSGRRHAASRLPRGIYIVGNRKVVVKGSYTPLKK